MSVEQIDNLLDSIDPLAALKAQYQSTRTTNLFDVFADLHAPLDTLELRHPPIPRMYRNNRQDGLRIRSYFAKALAAMDLTNK